MSERKIEGVVALHAHSRRTKRFIVSFFDSYVGVCTTNFSGEHFRIIRCRSSNDIRVGVWRFIRVGHKYFRTPTLNNNRLFLLEIEFNVVEDH